MATPESRAKLILQTARPFLARRTQMEETFGYYQSSPGLVSGLFVEMDRAIALTNDYFTKGNFDPELRPYTEKVRQAMPKPLPLLNSPQQDCETFFQAMHHQNHLMRYGEAIVNKKPVPTEVLDKGEYLTGHLRARTHDARLVGMALHGWDIYRGMLHHNQGSIPQELAVDAVSEQIALDMRDSKIWEVLVDPKGIHWSKPDFWFDPSAHFSEKLLASLKP